MKFCIIHGSPRKGNTYKATQMFIEQIKKNGENVHMYNIHNLLQMLYGQQTVLY
ncbi:MAG: NAD(P)H-dependent oxidoreductase [Ruminiclostridium sp.]